MVQPVLAEIVFAKKKKQLSDDKLNEAVGDFQRNLDELKLSFRRVEREFSTSLK